MRCERHDVHERTIATESGHNRSVRVAGRSDRLGGVQPALVGVANDLVRVSVGPPEAKYAVQHLYPHGIHILDVASFAIVAILLMGVAGFASWLPAPRSARVDPMVAPRSE